MINFKEEVINLIKPEVDSLSREEISSLIEVPPSYEMGDYAFPVFKLAKTFRKAPNLIAEELSAKFGEAEYFDLTTDEMGRDHIRESEGIAAMIPISSK